MLNPNGSNRKQQFDYKRRKDKKKSGTKKCEKEEAQPYTLCHSDPFMHDYKVHEVMCQWFRNV